MSVVAFHATRKPCVIALHCSGASGRAWDRLRQTLGDGFSMFAPDLIGCGSTPHWTRREAFRLTHEAAAAVAAIDACEEPVHLVGHSYGGGVALRAALERPRRIASLSLYEPTLFAVLGTMGAEGRAARAEVAAIAGEVRRHVDMGVPANAARRFVDYWNHPGAFDALKPEAQADIIRYVPKASLDFEALFHERVSLEALRALRIPLLMMRGEHVPRPAALIAQKLATVMGAKAFVTMRGAGHMGPFTHAEAVNRAIAQHIGVVAIPASTSAAA